MRVLSGTLVPWLVSTSTVVALVTTSQSNWPSCSSCRALARADGSSALAKLMSGAMTGVAPYPRSVAATSSPQVPPRGTSTRQPASGFGLVIRRPPLARLPASGARSAAPAASSSGGDPVGEVLRGMQGVLRVERVRAGQLRAAVERVDPRRQEEQAVIQEGVRADRRRAVAPTRPAQDAALGLRCEPARPVVELRDGLLVAAPHLDRERSPAPAPSASRRCRGTR